MGSPAEHEGKQDVAVVLVDQMSPSSWRTLFYLCVLDTEARRVPVHFAAFTLVAKHIEPGRKTQ